MGGKKFMTKKKKMVATFNILIWVIFILAIFFSINLNYSNEINPLDNEKYFKLNKADHWILTGSPIYIDDNDPARNWAITAATNDWCSGSGTWNDPYIIENVTIDGLSSWMEIRILNSEVYFILRNNTFFNGNTGIFLENVENGLITNNTVSYNSYQGISLIVGQNITISENIVEYNFRGLSLTSSSNNNFIRNNSFSFNGDPSGDNYAGIVIIDSNRNIIQENEVFSNENGGIFTDSDSTYNEILGNNIYGNEYGIQLSGNGNNQILGNNITNHDSGIYFELSSNYNNVSKNFIVNNTFYGVILDSNQNYIYFNNFSTNGINAYDKGLENKWDYGKVGNYWDDYSGVDADNNSIGDTPYNIPGPAQSKDYYPVIGSFESVVFYFPSSDIPPITIEIVIVSIIIAFGIIGSLGLIYGYRNYKRRIKYKGNEVETGKAILIPMIRKILYFIPIIVFFVTWWVDLGIGIHYLFIEDFIFSWVSDWPQLTDHFLIYTNTFSAFFFGCYTWSITTFILANTNPERFIRVIKSICLFYPFWFGMSIYLGIIGAGSYSNGWISVHIIFGLWVALGAIISIYMIVISSDNSLDWDKKYIIPRTKYLKLRDFFDRYQAFFFISIIFIIGTFFSILLGKVFISIFWTSLTIVLILLLNLLFSMKINYHTKIKQEELLLLLLDELQVLLRQSKDLAERGNKNYSKKFYQPAIESWEKSINYYEEALKKTPEKEKIKENLIILKEGMFNAYKGMANVHNKNALKAYEKSDLQISQKEWRLAISNFQAAIGLNKLEKLNFSSDDLQKATKNIEIRLKQLEIEIVILDADNELKEARSIQKKDLRKAIQMVNGIILKFSEAKEKANKNKLFKPLSETLETRIIKCREFQLRLQDKMDQFFGITPISKKIIVDEIKVDSEIPSGIKKAEKEPILSIIREFEFIGGQIRFKIGLKNNTRYSLTGLKITFDIPKALKWILHEPGYERKGDSLLISKLGVNEKKALSLYLEPINCMESPINATVSFFDVRDKPRALTMKPKMISITCPIFFTEVDANLARVKSLHRKLAHHDKKIFPLIKSEESLSIFSSILNVLRKFDIKLTFKDFSEEDRFGEAWFYGITKVKKNQIVIYVLLDGTDKKVEIEVSGNNEPQITAFLAEIGDRTRKQLIQNKIIDIEDDFYDMRVSILSKLCPYCYTSISGDQVQKFIDGGLIQCKNCNVELKINEK